MLKLKKIFGKGCYLDERKDDYDNYYSFEKGKEEIKKKILLLLSMRLYTRSIFFRLYNLPILNLVPVQKSK